LAKFPVLKSGIRFKKMEKSGKLVPAGKTLILNNLEKKNLMVILLGFKTLDGWLKITTRTVHDHA
jgi:hypothetical protein